MSTPCRPPPGHTYLTIGQDLFSIEDYVKDQYNYSLHHLSNSSRHVPTPKSFLPVAFMVYTDIQTLRGLERPVDYGSGIEYANGLIGATHGLQVGLWLNGSSGCQDIINQNLDAHIHHLLHYFLTSPFHVVFVRIGYEFDNPQFSYDNATLYRQAFEHVVHSCTTMTRRCRNKIKFVWHSWAAGCDNLPDYYPGDNVVDWIGISLFSQLYNTNNTLGNRDEVEKVLDFAKMHQKPVMIAESTPFGGIDALADPWADWFQGVLDLIDTYDISMWSYIQCDWDSQPMWHGVGFGDTRLSRNATILALWQQHVLHNPRFRATLNCNHDIMRLSNLGRFHQLNGPPIPGVVGVAVVFVVVVAAVMVAVGEYRTIWRRRWSGYDEVQEEDERASIPAHQYGTLVTE